MIKASDKILWWNEQDELMVMGIALSDEQMDGSFTIHSDNHDCNIDVNSKHCVRINNEWAFETLCDALKGEKK